MSTALEQYEITAEQVAAYLRANNDFFQEHGEILDDVFIPHRHTGDSISLLEHLVQRQRDRYAQLSRQMEDMLR
ncbi:MAG TPA: DUF484 family protein, partial [Thiolinea sp.]|nr:DUF484 family protein [Thiolinea sp.]